MKNLKTNEFGKKFEFEALKSDELNEIKGGQLPCITCALLNAAYEAAEPIRAAAR